MPAQSSTGLLSPKPSPYGIFTGGSGLGVVSPLTAPRALIAELGMLLK